MDEIASTDSRAIKDFWKKTARSRLRFELAGLAFALQKGATPEEYARHLWGKGARTWMKSTAPGAGDYLQKEAEAFRCFYPEVAFEVVEAREEEAELVFTDGCLGGTGEDSWKLARSLGLTKENVCSYCREAFQVWSGQLGLHATIGPDKNGTCRLRVAAS